MALTSKHIEFLSLVVQCEGMKLDGGAASDDEGVALWPELEERGLIEAVGSYKWKLTNSMLLLDALTSHLTEVERMKIQAAYDAAPKVVQAQVDALLGISVRKGDREGAGYPWTARPDSTLPPLGGDQ